MSALKAPFPYFGGKSSVSDLIWQRFGTTYNYVEPFFGSGAVFLNDANTAKHRTINDINCFVANFWRAIYFDPELTAIKCDYGMSHVDLHARNAWLKKQAVELTDKLKDDPHYYDVKIAAWWVWGMSCWIGAGFCAPNDGRKACLRVGKAGVNADGVATKRPRVSRGTGINSLPEGLSAQLPLLDHSQGANIKTGNALKEWFFALSDKFQGSKILCGDFERTLSPSITFALGTTAIFFDPPYSAADRDMVYSHDSLTVAKRVETWCKENESNPLLRLCIAGYEGDYDLPGWDCVAWKTQGGYSNLAKDGQGKINKGRERLYFSPHCLQPQKQLF